MALPQQQEQAAKQRMVWILLMPVTMGFTPSDWCGNPPVACNMHTMQHTLQSMWHLCLWHTLCPCRLSAGAPPRPAAGALVAAKTQAVSPSSPNPAAPSWWGGSLCDGPSHVRHKSAQREEHQDRRRARYTPGEAAWTQGLQLQPGFAWPSPYRAYFRFIVSAAQQYQGCAVRRCSWRGPRLRICKHGDRVAR